ncbi:MAG: hypothetical protein WBD23_05310, partial [Candidatus Acidiferrales bacterium]
MANDVDNSERTHEEELELGGSLLPLEDEETVQERRERRIARFRLLWTQRKFLAHTTFIGLVAATIIAFLIPKQFTSIA